MLYWNFLSILCTIICCAIVSTEGKEYVLVRRIYSGDEGRAMLEKDEHSKLLGWPLGLNTDLALMSSQPIFNAVLEKDDSYEQSKAEEESEKAEVVTQGSAHSTKVEVEHPSGKVQPDENGIIEHPRVKIDLSDHEPMTSETAKEGKTNELNVNKDESLATPSDISTTAAPSSVSEIAAEERISAEKAEKYPANSYHNEEDDIYTFDEHKIEEMMSRQKIRVMGPMHPLIRHRFVEIPPDDHLDQAESSSNVARKQHRHSETQEVPDQVLKIAEWLLNRPQY